MQDNEPINLTYGQMSDMVNRIEQIPPLSGTGAPTTSTPAFHLGQTYLDTTNDQLYFCSSIPGENDPLEYTWEPIDTNTTYSDFVGTDGTATGTHGLVPAPATTDADKFLKADGTWDTAGGGASTTVFYCNSGLSSYGTNPRTGTIFYKDVTYQTAATWADIIAAVKSGKVIICSNMSDDLFYTEVIGYYDQEGNYSISLANIDATPGYHCEIHGYNDGTTDHYTFSYKRIPEVVQTTGSNSEWVMSQNAATSMVFADPSTRYRVQIGTGSSTTTNHGIAIGTDATARAAGAIAIGRGADAYTQGQMDIGTSLTSSGYNNSNYRLLTGLYDPQSDHDAATKGYVDGLVGDIEAALHAINYGESS